MTLARMTLLKLSYLPILILIFSALHAGAQQCAMFNGLWRTDDNNISEMRLEQNGNWIGHACTITGSFVGSPFGEHYDHQVRGEGVEMFKAKIEVTRVGSSTHCVSKLYGEISYAFVSGRVDLNHLNWRITGTSGDCGLSKSFTETRIWERCPPSGCSREDE